MRLLQSLILVISIWIDNEPIPVESVILNISYLELTEGDSKQIYATILPQNASNKNVILTSSNSSVATVSDGVVTALNSGEAIITVKTEDLRYTRNSVGNV